jgi:hypothetical protein
MDSHQMRSYSVVFTDGEHPRSAAINAPDIEFAKMSARTMARKIVLEKSFGVIDPVSWRFVIESVDEGKVEEPFPLD